MIKIIEGTGGAYGCDENGNIYSFFKLGGRGELVDTPRKLAIFHGTTSNYDCVSFWLENKKQNHLVHRLIAKTWIPNPNNFPEVDHIDNNIHNNSVKNLQWVSRKDNMLRQTIDKGALNGLRTQTKLFDPQGKCLGTFPSLNSACEYATQFGCSKTGMAKYKKTKNGYYVEMAYNPKLEKHSNQLKKVWELFSPENKSFGIFNSIAEAGKYIKENIQDISIKLFQVHKKAYGYYVVEKSVETNRTLGDEHQGEAQDSRNTEEIVQ